ncbi:hypothetical protein D3C73_1633290 [compost metagenome]
MAVTVMMHISMRMTMNVMLVAMGMAVTVMMHITMRMTMNVMLLVAMRMSMLM